MTATFVRPCRAPFLFLFARLVHPELVSCKRVISVDSRIAGQFQAVHS